MLRDAHGIELRVCRITDAGELDMDDLAAKLADGKVGLVAVTHMSQRARHRHAGRAHRRAWRMRPARKVLFDGSQAAVHRRVDVQALDADFYVFTGHKLYGPTGIGVLWAQGRSCWSAMPPFLGGGDMIADGHLRDVATGRRSPAKFEAGTPPIIEAVGPARRDRLRRPPSAWPAIEAHERALVDHAMAPPAAYRGRHAARPRAGPRRRLRLRARHRACARPGDAAGPRRHRRARRAATAPSRCMRASASRAAPAAPPSASTPRRRRSTFWRRRCGRHGSSSGD